MSSEKLRLHSTFFRTALRGRSLLTAAPVSVIIMQVKGVTFLFPYLNLFGTQIPMYGLCMSLAMLTALGLSCIRTHRRGGDLDRLLTIALAAIVCGIVGSKLLYIFVTFSPKELVELIRANGITSILQGGLVFYGGLIGGLIGAFVGARIARIRLCEYSDPVVPTLPLAHAIGRMGCFCSGCCYGKMTDSWLGMRFPHSVTGLSPDVCVIPTQLIEAGVNVLICVFLLLYTRRKRYGFKTLFVYIVCYGVARFLIEFLRGDEIRGIFGFLSTSQWISLGMIAVGIVGIILTDRAEKRRAAELAAAGAAFGDEPVGAVPGDDAE